MRDDRVVVGPCTRRGRFDAHQLGRVVPPAQGNHLVPQRIPVERAQLVALKRSALEGQGLL